MLYYNYFVKKHIIGMRAKTNYFYIIHKHANVQNYAKFALTLFEKKNAISALRYVAHSIPWECECKCELKRKFKSSKSGCEYSLCL